MSPAGLWALLRGDGQADRAVPPSGITARLTLLTAAAMAFLAVFALAFSGATGRLADRWSAELARTSTLRISAPEVEADAQLAAALRVLETTPGVASARALTDEEERALLEPWFGPDLPIESLPIPRLVEIVETEEGYDATGLRARLQAEVPAAVLDDHTRWRAPLIAAAERLRLFGALALVLIGGALVAMVTLAAQASLAANAQVIRVMRLVGARDAYIARAFVRRFTVRAVLGALAGTVAGVLAVRLVPAVAQEGFLAGLGLGGADWLGLALIPLFAGGAAFAATRAAALSTLRKQA